MVHHCIGCHSMEVSADIICLPHTVGVVDHFYKNFLKDILAMVLLIYLFTDIRFQACIEIAPDSPDIRRGAITDGWLVLFHILGSEPAARHGRRCG